MHTLHELTERIFLTMKDYDFEIILVDDFSVDNSWNTLLNIKQNNTTQNIILVKLSKNFGQQSATLCGISYASGDYVITIDDDLQTPPEEINKLIHYNEEKNIDVLYGIYKIQQHSFLRSKLKEIGFSIMKKINPQIGNTSSFRLINKQIVDYLKKPYTHIVNIDEVIQWYTHSIDTIDVIHHERKEGKSNYNLFNLVKLAFSSLFQYYTIPLHIISSLGLYISASSMLLAIYYIIKKFLFRVSIEGWTSLMVVLLFSTGIIVFSLGVIGKYLFQILNTQNGKPPYIVKDVK